jgi:ferrous iron transport protein B
MGKSLNIALLGNPNTGKTSVFNALTGLTQKVGNYPGITVEKKEGICNLNRTTKGHIIDLPGTYSLNASSMDESVVIELLLNKNSKDFPDVCVVVTDVENLKRNLLLFTQVKDLGLPTLLVINMADQMKRKGISIDIPFLEKAFDTKIALVSTRKNIGLEVLQNVILNYRQLSTAPTISLNSIDKDYFQKLEKIFPNQSIYKLWLIITQDVNYVNIDRKRVSDATDFKTLDPLHLKRLQQKETVKRFQFINKALKQGLNIDREAASDFRSRFDRVLIHKFWGYVIFFVILMTIFQSIFDWSSIPMDFIDFTFASLSEILKNELPEGVFTSLLTEGIIPGLGGIVIFIPQIAFLFLFISVLEETGYMSRVVFLMDRGLRRFGLSGKSVIPLISGTACAIPAVMATRNIENWKERLITILVTPFTTCSARLPVYAILIALVIPEGSFLGFNYKGLMLMALYLIGFVMALLAAWILSKTLSIKSKSYFVVEMPNYKIPLFKNVGITVWEKTRTFITEAGKIILAISILLWIMASYGPGKDFYEADKIIFQDYPELNQAEMEIKVNSYKLEHSYIGILGKTIEPLISPLGYDWKIGIALISSFAAREVFVGTLATIYSVENGKEDTIKNKMSSEIRADGSPLFNMASGISLMLFYAFAMQCMSTLAIVKKETNSWKWPTIQFFGMTLLAYIVAFSTYQILA